ncbi:MAG: 50S ribosomal protein L18 [bacterium]|nr:50S ribosomal protein L18 [bacterium]
MNLNSDKNKARAMRHRRVRAKVKGNSKRLRLNVFRSHQHIYAQLIDDQTGKTAVAFSSLKLSKPKTKKTDIAFEVGKGLAAAAAKLGIKQVSFDRGGYAFHGRVKSVAAGAREGGLEF